MWALLEARRCDLVRSVVIVGLAGLLLGACSCGEGQTHGRAAVGAVDLPPDPLELADYLVDFGPVWLGDEAYANAVIRNEGAAELVLGLERLEPPFSVGPELRIPVGGEAPLALSFFPAEEGSFEAILDASTNEEGGRRIRFRLIGKAILPKVVCDPEIADFGTMPIGENASLSVRCSNPGPIELSAALGGIEGISRQSFAAEAVEGDPRRLVLAPGGGVELDIRFRASVAGVQQAALPFLDSQGGRIHALTIRAEATSSVLQLDPADCVNFGAVALGEVGRRTLTVRNVGNEPEQLLDLEIDAAAGFSVTTPLPIELEGGSSAEVELEFAPLRPGSARSYISVQASTDALLSCATGTGGLPALACEPEVLDFGQIALISPAERRLRCTHQGPDTGEEVSARLKVLGLHADDEAFSARVWDPIAAIEGPDESGYAVGESFYVEVLFAPKVEGVKAATLTVQTDLAGPVDVPLLGDGRELPPCEFVVEPAEVRFGTVDRGKSLERPLEVRNLQGTACLLTELRLADGSDPEFSVEEVPSQIIDGFGSFVVMVRFTPLARKPSYSGAIEFQISNPDERQQRVGLVGSSNASCLAFEPPILDFGTVEPGCRSPVRTLTVRSLCGSALTMDDLELVPAPGSDAFVIETQPSLPRALNAGATLEIPIRFQPVEEGPHQTAIALQLREGPSSGAPEWLLSPVVGTSAEGFVHRDRLDWQAPPKVDFLWVVDSAQGFTIQGSSISGNFGRFITALVDQGIDFQVGVTSTDATFNERGCGGEDGRLAPIDGSRPRILTPTTPDLENNWRRNLNVAQCGYYSYGLESAKRALSEPLISEVRSSRHVSTHLDGNAGFLRNDAALSIILMMKGGVNQFLNQNIFDSSEGDDQEYLDFFLSLKGDPRQVKIHAVSGPPTTRAELNCGWISLVGYSDRYMPFLQATGGHWMNICTPYYNRRTWDEGMEAIVQKGVIAPKRLFLNSAPGGDLELWVDGDLLPPVDESGNARWTYDPLNNAIDFAPLFGPPQGSEVEATYRATCAQE